MWPLVTTYRTIDYLTQGLTQKVLTEPIRTTKREDIPNIPVIYMKNFSPFCNIFHKNSIIGVIEKHLDFDLYKLPKR